MNDTHDARDEREAPRTQVRGLVGLKISGHTIVGAIMLLLGVLWTLDNLDVMDSDRAIQFWPIGLVAFGVAKLQGWNTRQDRNAGTALTIIGSLMLLRPLGIIHTSIFSLWPLLMIAGGLALLRRARTPVEDLPPGSAEVNDAHLSVLALMGGAARRVHSRDFRGAEASAIMGGVELDLRNAATTVPKVYVDVFTWWGGIEIIVPRDWKVDTEATPIMGAVVDTTKAPDAPVVTTLVVRGIVIMGGVEVKNKSSVRVEENS